MFESLAKALAAGLSLWESKEKRRYLDELIELKRKWYAEFNLGEGNRSNAVLDGIELELRILTDSFSSAVGTKDAGNSP
jgi:hypothetical protein